MIVVDCEQGSETWKSLRLGRPTASNFDKIITNETAKFSKSSTKYAYALIAESLLGVEADGASSGFMARGKDVEKEARLFYEMAKSVDVKQVGFVMRDDRRVGCSPDGLIGDDGLLEMKCPSAAVHVGYLAGDMGIGYQAQVQGQLWLTGRKWVDTVSYHGLMPSTILRVARDDGYILKLEEAVNQFLSFVDETKLKLIDLGYFEKGEFDSFADLKVA